MLQSLSTRHAVVIPLFGGALRSDLEEFLRELLEAGLQVVLVDNNPTADPIVASRVGVHYLHNANSGGIAGGFNRGVELAIALGAQWITLLDQDSRLPPHDFHQLLEPWQCHPEGLWLVGPLIVDGRSQKIHGKPGKRGELGIPDGFLSTRLLISSGTTFAVKNWSQLGPFDEPLVIDFVDHVWVFRAQSRGFRLLQHPHVRLQQQFGNVHPQRLCRWLGLELYSPTRHYYSLRNLRWLVHQPTVPLDLRCKELAKMLVKPWLWLLFEPKRRDNLQAIWRGLRDPLPLPLRNAS